MKNAIVYLIRGDQKSLEKFDRSLALLARNFLPWNPADIFIFHENNVTDEHIRQHCHGLRVTFALVDFSNRPSALTDDPQAMNLGGLGYRHMCHFWANDVFLRAELSEYDYLMRLDDDSYILSPIGYNVFAEMKDRGARYAYRVIDFDVYDVCIGLAEVSRAFFRAHPEVEKRGLKGYPPYYIYYTNFEISDLSWFRASPWQQFFQAIDSAGGIWRYRWGDAPIRYIGVNCMLEEDEVLCVLDLHYEHQSVWRAGRRTRLIRDNIGYFLKVTRLRLSLFVRRLLRDLFSRV